MGCLTSDYISGETAKMKTKSLDLQNENWENWKWQQKNAIKDVKNISSYFPNMDRSFFENMSQKFKFQMTPYMLSKISTSYSQEELEKDPFYLQFFPLGEINDQGHDAYDGTDNWEFSEEFPTSNLHHKYPNRALIRTRNCLAYCNFCFEALGILEKNPKQDKIFKWDDWKNSLDYIKNNPQVEEVILSGGEPFLMSDNKLEQILQDLSDIPNVRFKRIHTRVLTHNPYRITDSLVKSLRDHKVNEIAFDVAHPSEITDEFKEGMYRIREGMGKNAPILATHTPLIKDVNNNEETLWELFGSLYELNIKPYYLIHSMPHTPFGDKQRVPVKEGVKLMKKLKRHKSNIAIPEYIITHYDGKITVPLEMAGTPEFQYTQDQEGNPIVRFKNWKDKWVEYPDSKNII